MNPEVKIILRVHEDALATVPTPDELKALLGFEPSYFIVDRQTITAQRTRAPQITSATTLPAMLSAWLEATGQEVGERSRTLCEKLAEIEG